MKREHGFTFIEVMVVVSMIGILVLVTVPMGVNWVQSAKLSIAKGELVQAVGRAKGAAMRNERAAMAGDPVAVICFSDSSILTVLEGTSVSEPDCIGNVGTQVWTARLDKDVSIVGNGSSLNCLCFDNLGVLTATKCSGCLTTNVLSLSAGSRYENIYIN